MYGIIWCGAWVRRKLAGGEIDTTDYIDQAMTLQTQEEADEFAAMEMADFPANTVSVISIRRR